MKRLYPKGGTHAETNHRRDHPDAGGFGRMGGVQEGAVAADGRCPVLFTGQRFSSIDAPAGAEGEVRYG